MKNAKKASSLCFTILKKVLTLLPTLCLSQRSMYYFSFFKSFWHRNEFIWCTYTRDKIKVLLLASAKKNQLYPQLKKLLFLPKHIIISILEYLPLVPPAPWWSDKKFRNLFVTFPFTRNEQNMFDQTELAQHTYTLFSIFFEYLGHDQSIRAPPVTQCIDVLALGVLGTSQILDAGEIALRCNNICQNNSILFQLLQAHSSICLFNAKFGE
jgi:hypothetical protein